MSLVAIEAIYCIHTIESHKLAAPHFDLNALSISKRVHAKKSVLSGMSVLCYVCVYIWVDCAIKHFRFS